MKRMIGFVIAAALIVFGGLIFVIAMSVNGWDFGKLGSSRLETNIYEITEDFDGITIETDTADIEFFPSNDGKCKVVCYEREAQGHTVEVKDGKLSVKISDVDVRKWYSYILNFGGDKITVYLPKQIYSSLFIETDTGDVEIGRAFTFGSAEIIGSTGDVEISASVEGKLYIKMSTGDIELEDLTAAEIEAKASTGDIEFENVKTGSANLSVSTGEISIQSSEFSGDLAIKVSTGKSYLENVTCKNLTSSGNTGDISLKKVIASEKISIERSTGDVRFNFSDAAEISVETDTGSVKGTLLSEKVFIARSDTGKIDVPKTKNGGFCEITTDTGNIIISLVTD